MSGQGRSVPDSTSLMRVGDDYVRDVIHAFNERGFAALDPKWGGGRPRTISEQVREHICLITKTVPAEWGIAGMSTWSLPPWPSTSSLEAWWPRTAANTCGGSCARAGWPGGPPPGSLQRPVLHRQDAARAGVIRSTARRGAGGLRR
ncbi:helix-turn-helix domain-containing protein [Streptosporangium sp. NPDC052375]